MKLTPLFTLAVALGMTVLAGCAEDLRNASPAAIEKLVTVKAPDSRSRAWSAPELQVRRYRTLFYGYDTVYYRLTAIKPEPLSGITLYRLLIDANYGGAPRHYGLAKKTNGEAYPANHQRHETERCQFFNSMVSSCLYRDRADIELNLAELQTGRHAGLTLTLASPDSDYERIDLPANYIDGFLRAIPNP